MAVYVVTGKLGGGKTLACVDRISEALREGRVVATNLDMQIHKLPFVGRYAKRVRVLRCPDKPTAEDIRSLGYGIEGVRNDDEARRRYDEKRFGVLVLDECGTWFNAREWSEEGRRELINELLHIRKKLWHVYLIIQDISMLDKQARKALAEHVVYCRRLDRLAVPFFGFWYQRFTGEKMPMPQIHVAIVKYGDRPDSLTVERWFYRGKHLWAAYDTTQVFSETYGKGLYQYLPPWYIFGKAQVVWSWGKVMKFSKIYLRQYSQVVLVALGLLLGSGVMYWRSAKAQEEFRSTLAAERADYASEQRRLRLEIERAKLNGGRRRGGGEDQGDRWEVLEEASIEPGHWAAWFKRGVQEYFVDDLGLFGWEVSRVGPCAYRLQNGKGELQVARCARPAAMPRASAATAAAALPFDPQPTPIASAGR